MKMHRWAIAYFALQGLGVFVWWCFLVFAPWTREYFRMGEGESILLSFWLPDLLLLGFGSLATVWLILTKSEFLSIALWLVAGAFGYAALYCLSFAMMTDTGWLGVLFMMPAMLWSGVFAVGLTKSTQDSMFRVNRSEKTSWILFKTFSQIVVVWTLILVVFPYLIVLFENKIGIPQFSFPFQKIIAAVLFVLVSLPGVASAYVMSKIGRGTPLPLDHAPKLVIAGVYAYVRNPMAVSGIGQGLAVALFLGSPLVFIYALTGSLIWQIVFRELEEIDLKKRFGADYEDYCREVRCWVPNLKPYRSASERAW
jgi:protein-S-isoprenylcysteine O-methyltransferase Ste14